MKKMLLPLLLAGTMLSAGEHFKEKAFLLGTNMAPASRLPQIEALAARAAKAGYNTVYLSDYKFGTPWKHGDAYAQNVKKAVDILRKYKFKVVTSCIPIGDCCSYLSGSPELAECLKVTAEPYTVKGGVFTPQSVIKNGSFEEGFKHWRPDTQKVDISLDTKVAASGKTSVHFKLTGKEPHNQSRIWYHLDCKPFQQMALTFKIKTKNIKGSGNKKCVSFAVVAKDPGAKDGFRYLTYRNEPTFNRKPIKETADWQEYRVIFNTFELSQIRIALGCWKIQGPGEVWIDDVDVKPASFLNVIRRKGTEPKVTSADGKIIYTEGKDYAKIVDPKAGHVRWIGDFNDAHAAPQIKVLPGSRIKEVQTILASYYHVALSQKHACICINNPETKKYITRTVEWQQKHIKPDGILIGIDEHRAYGYDPDCEKSGLTAAQALNMIAKYSYNEIKRIAPKAQVYMWNDMFDPYSNCGKGRYYYMIKGKSALWNSWKDLPKDIIIMRWSPSNVKTKRAALQGSMDHWRNLGLKFVEFPGYFDAPTFNPHTEGILEMAKQNPNCIGVAYGQWSGINGYKPHFEKFIKVVEKIDKKK